MPLSLYEAEQNYIRIDRVIKKYFADVKNRLALSNYIQKFLNENEIALSYYTGPEYKNYIRQAIAATIKDSVFNEKVAFKEFSHAVEQIRILEKKERIRYQQQQHELGSLAQLKKYGYVESGHRLRHSEIDEMFQTYLSDIKDVYASDTISITDDEGRALLDILKKYKDVSGTLYIPVNVYGNHYLLLTRTQLGNKVDLTCWDPLGEPKEKLHNEIKTKLNMWMDQVYEKKSYTTGYVYAGEQKDGYTCGYRVVQKAMKDAQKGMKDSSRVNEFIQVKPNDVSNLCYQFIKLLAATDKELADKVKDPRVVVEGKVTISEVIANDKVSQIKSDEYLAVALQYVYLKDRDISSTDALKLAYNAKLEGHTYKKNEISVWAAKTQLFKHRPNCSKEVAREDDTLQLESPVMAC